MAYGKTILYQDFNDVGVGNNRFFAEDINDFIMAMQGNYTISGCLAAVGGETDLSASGTHVTIASGVAFVNGEKRTISAANVNLSTAFNALTTGQSRLILIYINSSGVVATISGDRTTDGNQLPESVGDGWTPVDTTPLAWIYLTEADSLMEIDQIRDNIVYSPKGGFFEGGDSYFDDIFIGDNDIINIGDSNDLQLYHDGTNSIINNNTGELHIDALSHINLRSGTRVRVKDIDDSYATLWSLDTSARTLDIGSVGDPIATKIYGAVNNPLDNSGFYTGAGDDLRMYHDGIASFLSNNTGDLIIENVLGNIKNNTGRIFRVADSDDSDAPLLDLNTSTRILLIGSAVDPIATSLYGAVKNPLDNAGFYTGAGDDLRMYHNGSSNIIGDESNATNLSIEGRFINFFTTEAIQIKDTNDSDVSLFIFNTTARTFDIGAASDNIASSLYGTVKNPLDNSGFYTGASDDFRMYHDGGSINYLDSFDTKELRLYRNLNIRMYTKGSITVNDRDDSDVEIYNFDSNARTLDIGASADNIVSTFHGNTNILGELEIGAGAVGRFSASGGTTSLNNNFEPSLNSSFDVGGVDIRWDVIYRNSESSASNREMKTNFDYDDTNALELLSLLATGSFDWKHNLNKQYSKEYGIILEEIPSELNFILHETTNKRGEVIITGIQYDNLTALNTKGIQELIAEVEEIKEMIK